MGFFDGAMDHSYVDVVLVLSLDQVHISISVGLEGLVPFIGLKLLLYGVCYFVLDGYILKKWIFLAIQKW